MRPLTSASRSVLLPAGRVEHAVLPPHGAGFTTTSEAFSVGVSFTGHHDAVVRDGVVAAPRSFGPGTVGVAGPAPVTWEQVVEPSESVELHPDPVLLSDLGARLGVDWSAREAYAQFPPDAVSVACAARLRAAATGAAPLDPLEADEVAHRWLVHLAVSRLGGRPPRSVGQLDGRRLRAVAEHVEQHLASGVTLADLSAAAWTSPFHLLRSFRRTTGMTPHAYVTAVRMERAHRLLEAGDGTVAAVASAVGVADVAHFRRLHRRAFGRSPRG